MYQALYRKYRPRSFGDVSGQSHITETLREQMKADRLSHAYLFVGTRGTGKTTCAKILSRAVNCLNPDQGDACNKCDSCIGIENGSILDVLEIDAASNNGVDNIRALREEAVYTPALVKKRIYIVDEVHMLSTSAFNALLKILEEPPEHLIFILATTELHKVPATIMSRCQRFMFRRISQDAISARLDDIATKEKITLTEEASKKLATLADGSMRDAISLFDQCATGETVNIERVLDTIGLAGVQEITRLAEAVADRNINNSLEILEKLYDDGRDMLSLLNELGALMRDLLVFKLSPSSPLVSVGRDQSTLKDLTGKLSSERLFFILELIREAAYNLTRSGAMKLTAQMCLIRMCEERLSDDMSALASRVAELERRGESGERAERGERREERGERSEENDSLCSADEIDPQPSFDKEGPYSTAEGNREDKGTDGAGDLIHSTTEADDTKPDFWSDILENLKNEPALYPVVSNKNKVWAEIHDSRLLLRASDPFTVNQLEMDVFMDTIKEAAKKALGHEVAIRVEIGVREKNDERLSDKAEKPEKNDESDKLDMLISTFSNVTIEE